VQPRRVAVPEHRQHAGHRQRAPRRRPSGPGDGGLHGPGVGGAPGRVWAAPWQSGWAPGGQGYWRRLLTWPSATATRSRSGKRTTVMR
jgi:hypothetical protein